ncbi:MAG: DUF5916 domain-containing protein [Thermoanaerobaculia bacterium]
MALPLLEAGAQPLLAQPAPTSRPSVSAAVAAGPIRVDGVLDEAAWQAAGVLELTQQSPRPGEPTPFRTEVRVLVDAENLYFGFSCDDPEPGRIAIHTLQRDANLEADDTVTIVLDTFGDGLTGYFFQINAGAARTDGLISGPEEQSRDWDGIWDAATRRTASGWTAEIQVPAATLRFPEGRDAWGFNVERSVPRDLLFLRWTGTTLDAKFDDLSRAGSLSGMAGLRQGLGLSVVPYALAQYFHDPADGRKFVKGQAGGDVRYSFTPQLEGVLTARPDFAETEADARQVNLTRFPLFFPEKRAFFLEGSSLFRFGLGLEGYFIPFYSRRIGLFEGNVVPIDVGAKVLGQAGRFGIGVLDTQTAAAGGAERANLFAGRLTYDVDEHLRVGAIGTNGEPSGVRANWLAGVDAVWRTSSFRGDKNFFVGVWGAGSGGDVGDGRRTGYGIKIDYPNDLWDVSFRFDKFGDSFEPALGFLPRSGVRQYRLGIAYQPRPEGGPFGWIRQFFFELVPTLVENLSGQTESWRVFTAPFNARTRSGWHLEANWVPQFERLSEPFEVSSGVVIPAGSYPFTRFRFEVNSPDALPLRVSALVWFGNFFSGRLTETFASVAWSEPSGHLQLELDAANAYGYLPEGNFIQRLWQLRAAYSFSPDLFFQSFVQYDSVSRNVGMNSLFRWTIRPGRDLFLVWNHGWTSPLKGGTANLRTIGDEVVLKLRWTFRR